MNRKSRTPMVYNKTKQKTLEPGIEFLFCFFATIGDETVKPLVYINILYSYTIYIIRINYCIKELGSYMYIFSFFNTYM